MRRRRRWRHTWTVLMERCLTPAHYLTQTNYVQTQKKRITRAGNNYNGDLGLKRATQYATQYAICTTFKTMKGYQEVLS